MTLPKPCDHLVGIPFYHALKTHIPSFRTDAATRLLCWYLLCRAPQDTANPARRVVSNEALGARIALCCMEPLRNSSDAPLNNKSCSPSPEGRPACQQYNRASCWQAGCSLTYHCYCKNSNPLLCDDHGIQQ